MPGHIHAAVQPMEPAHLAAAPRTTWAETACAQLRHAQRPVLGIRDGRDPLVNRDVGIESQHLPAQRHNFRAHPARFCGHPPSVAALT